MKRAGNLFTRIHSWDNLRVATAKAMRGKRTRPEVAEFCADLDRNLALLAREIAEGSLQPGGFRQFVIHDPKRRIISAPPFRDRVLHHAIMNVCEPALESFSIHHSYACRSGKGQFAALEQAIRFSRKRDFFLKLDVWKYFESIPKDRLLKKLARRFKEPRLHALFARIIDSFEPDNFRGVPIGALTSQHFANFYLGYLDRFVKEKLRVKEYLRYMDDFVLWHDERSVLVDFARSVEAFADTSLGLNLKQPHIGESSSGLDFLGHRVYPRGCRLNRRSRRRFRHRYRVVMEQWRLGDLDEQAVQDRLDSLVAFTRHSACLSWRRGVVSGSGSRPETAPTA